MKKVVKISISVAMMTIAIMFFGGCDKETGTPALTSGAFNGRISATVDAEDWDLSNVKYVAPFNLLGLQCNGNDCNLVGEQMGDRVSFSNNKFTVNLPDPPPSNVDMTEIKEVFEDFMSGDLKFSDAKVLVVDVDFIMHNGTNYMLGMFTCSTADKKTTCMFVYAESNVTVTGGSNVSVKFEEGWNRVYVTVNDKNVITKITTKAPEGDLKWYVEILEP